jgi:hypothetical protein
MIIYHALSYIQGEIIMTIEDLHDDIERQFEAVRNARSIEEEAAMKDNLIMSMVWLICLTWRSKRRNNMRILDKYKDYYDHIVGEYGIDNTIFYDRRGSKKLTQHNIIKLFKDAHEVRFDCGIHETKKYPNPKIYGIVEAGYYQYLIRVVDVICKPYTYIENDQEHWKHKYDGKVELMYVFNEHKHYFKTPLSVCGVTTKGHFSDFEKVIKSNKMLFFDNEIELDKRYVIENPILIGTRIPAIIDPHLIYINIFDYISSKADFEIVDTRGDVAKAVDHGFDKKTSFRKM